MKRQPQVFAFIVAIALVVALPRQAESGGSGEHSETASFADAAVCRAEAMIFDGLRLTFRTQHDDVWVYDFDLNTTMHLGQFGLLASENTAAGVQVHAYRKSGNAAEIRSFRSSANIASIEIDAGAFELTANNFHVWASSGSERALRLSHTEYVNFLGLDTLPVLEDPVLGSAAIQPRATRYRLVGNGASSTLLVGGLHHLWFPENGETVFSNLDDLQQRGREFRWSGTADRYENLQLTDRLPLEPGRSYGSGRFEFARWGGEVGYLSPARYWAEKPLPQRRFVFQDQIVPLPGRFYPHPATPVFAPGRELLGFLSDELRDNLVLATDGGSRLGYDGLIDYAAFDSSGQRLALRYRNEDGTFFGLGTIIEGELSVEPLINCGGSVRPATVQTRSEFRTSGVTSEHSEALTHYLFRSPHLTSGNDLFVFVQGGPALPAAPDLPTWLEPVLAQGDDVLTVSYRGNSGLSSWLATGPDADRPWTVTAMADDVQAAIEQSSSGSDYRQVHLIGESFGAYLLSNTLSRIPRSLPVGCLIYNAPLMSLTDARGHLSQLYGPDAAANVLGRSDGASARHDRGWRSGTSAAPYSRLEAVYIVSGERDAITPTELVTPYVERIRDQNPYLSVRSTVVEGAAHSVNSGKAEVLDQAFRHCSE